VCTQHILGMDENHKKIVVCEIEYRIDLAKISKRRYSKISSL
jgi:hypothetical protein